LSKCVVITDAFDRSETDTPRRLFPRGGRDGRQYPGDAKWRPAVGDESGTVRDPFRGG
jgi:hypothetical protein